LTALADIERSIGLVAPEDANCNTLSGLALHCLGRMPRSMSFPSSSWALASVAWSARESRSACPSTEHAEGETQAW